VLLRVACGIQLRLFAVVSLSWQRLGYVQLKDFYDRTSRTERYPSGNVHHYAAGCFGQPDSHYERDIESELSEGSTPGAERGRGCRTSLGVGWTDGIRFFDKSGDRLIASES